MAKAMDVKRRNKKYETVFTAKTNSAKMKFIEMDGEIHIEISTSPEKGDDMAETIKGWGLIIG